jgi:two-component sensor histidine kinase/CHASE3 domain sensor protein
MDTQAETSQGKSGGAAQGAAERSLEPLFRSRRFTFALVGGLVLIIAIALAAALSLLELDRQQQQMKQTLTIQSEARLYVNAIQGVETSQRGYLLTGDQRYLNNFERLVSGFRSSADHLKTLVAGRPEQQERLTNGDAAASRMIAELTEALDAYRTGRKEDALRMTSEGDSEDLMDQIRGIFSSFLGANQARANGDAEEVTATARRLFTLILVGLFGLVLLAVMAILGNRRQLNSLLKHRNDLSRLAHSLEERVKERTADLEEARHAAEHERARAEALLRDVNHRVGNNLALVSSFLGLQLRTLRDPQSRRVLEAARVRVHTIAATQRKLRLGSETEMTHIDTLLREVIEDVTATLPESQQLNLQWDIAPIRVQSRDAVSVGVIVCELVLNAVKYAFQPDGNGTIRIAFRRGDEGAEILVEDDGIGKIATPEEESGGLGTQIIYLLCTQFGGEPHYDTPHPGRPRPGLIVRVPLPKLKIDELSE